MILEKLLLVPINLGRVIKPFPKNLKFTILKSERSKAKKHNLYLGYGAGIDAEGDLYSGMENVMGTSYDDILIGNYDSNYIRGAGGNDLIHDFLQGGEGEDIYNLIDATGITMIDNFASDGKADDIYVDDYVQLEISQQKLL